MQNITIDPQSSEIRTKADALRIKNDFFKNGFKTRAAFLQVMQDKDNSFLRIDKLLMLQNWWLGRSVDEDLNNKIQNVLNSLRNE